MLKDRMLIRKFNKGSKDALRDIYQQYKDELLSLAVTLLYDKSYAEDVLHDVFIAFAKTSGDFRLTGSLKGYLATCIANRVRNINSAMRRKKVMGLDDAISIPLNRPDPALSLVANEQSQQLARYLDKLPDEQREIVVLHLQYNIKFREIAQDQGVSINTIQSRYRYGLDKLRALLESENKNGSCKHRTIR